MSTLYNLANAKFVLQVKDGILYSIGAAGNPYQTEYIDKDKGFGRLTLTYMSQGIRSCWKPLEEGAPVTEGVKRQGRHISCEYHSCNALLSVTVTYLLENDTLHQGIRITNLGEESVILEDVGFTFACHSDFGWGREAAREVIGHHFISAHGSHSTFYRCDGAGPILAALPVKESQWLYYDCPKKEEHEQGKGTVIIYPLNGHIGELAQKKGAKLREPVCGQTLGPCESWETFCDYFFAADYEDCKREFVRRGQIWPESVPGYTVPRDQHAALCITSREKPKLWCGSDDLHIRPLKQEGDNYFYRLDFQGLGERDVQVDYGGRTTHLYYFITEPIDVLLEKRAAFLVRHQITDEEKWYRGLFAEWNNETGVELSPDNYDRIKGWRRYEVTCDDPGLSKPAFLSSKQTVSPVQEQVDALDDYISHFVWGGLQQTEDEPYPYAIYGIPDWYTLRHSEKEGNDGRTHLWRIYDYPHIFLLYFNMYKTAKLYPKIKTRLTGADYLYRAYRTALALFQVPEELEGWSAYKTGLYNELVIPDIIEALKEEGFPLRAARLSRYWQRKVSWFVRECGDIFGSEYPFDTTGFESTQILAKEALQQASYQEVNDRFSDAFSYDKAVSFMENQIACNIACRGLMEPAYFWYGSDYRGGNMHYTLSYMSQMGGWALLDYACYYAQSPFELLRLAYGSLQSSWALLNSGDEESHFGWWFPGKENDGCACGGFEPLYGHETWLEQPNPGGAWYYSCEIDLGFCGGIRGASIVLAQDPLFGMTAYGALLEQRGTSWILKGKDGVGRRFHFIGKNGRIHIEMEGIRLAEGESIRLEKEGDELAVHLDREDREGRIRILTEGLGLYTVDDSADVIEEGETFFLKPKGDWVILRRSF